MPAPRPRPPTGTPLQRRLPLLTALSGAVLSPEAVEELEARTMKEYGNPLGPTADQRFAAYGSRAAVISAATRSSAAVDQELGAERRP